MRLIQIAPLTHLKSEVLLYLYSHSKFNATAILYKLAICKGKILYGIVLYEIAIFMKEYFNSFDDIQFFDTFSSISQDI